MAGGVIERASGASAPSPAERRGVDPQQARVRDVRGAAPRAILRAQTETTGGGAPIRPTRRLIAVTRDLAMRPKFRILRAGRVSRCSPHSGRIAQRRLHALLLCAAAIAAGPLGCGNERKLQGEAEPDTATCSRCHGGADNAAPPLSVKGDRDATDMAVGAHQAHLRGGALRAPLACSDCHLAPGGRERRQPHRRARDRDVRRAGLDGRRVARSGPETREAAARRTAMAGRSRAARSPRRSGIAAPPRPPAARATASPRRRHTCRTRTAAVATSGTPLRPWSRPRTWTARST